EVMYTTFFREKVKRLFSTFSFFFHLSLPLVSFLTWPPKRFVVTTDAHYRESENSSNPYFAFSFRSRFFSSKR
ncbi:hypothetical protein AB7044_16630, partial [Providencia stuartii]|uniref:hypothetical protein n=1 Tax=Providencia stuartii TaxID=588 RepID=UPI0034E3BA4D